MLAVTVDNTKFKQFSASFPEQHRRAAASVLKSISYQSNQMLKAFAISRAGGKWGPYAPITPLFRKGRGLGPWFARFSQYGVDAEGLIAKFGILAQEDVAGMVRKKGGASGGGKPIKPLSKQFKRTAEIMATGYKFRQSFRRQRGQAKYLMNRMGTNKKIRLAVVRHWQATGGTWHRLIPRVGMHHVKPRPVVAPFMPTIRTFATRNMIRLYQLKIVGMRYRKDWYL